MADMIVVRPATPADVPGIRDVLAVTWRDTYGAFLPLEAIERATAAWHAPHVLQAELARRGTFSGVAEDQGGAVVGMVTARARRDRLDISRLYVRPEAQRRGIGGRLLLAACEAFPGARRLRLEVEARNPKGRAFYAKAGFVEASERWVEVGGFGVHVIVMERVDAAASDAAQ